MQSALFATTGKLKAELEAARERAAKDLGTTPKRLMTDAALQAVLDARPVTELALRGVPGVGLRAAAALAKDVARLFGNGTAIIEQEPVVAAEEPAEHQVRDEDPALSVGEYLQELNVALGRHGAVVRGEVTEAREYPSGIYFSIKDASGADGVLNCYLPPYRVRLFGHLLGRGAEIRVAGAPKIALRKGGFSFQVEAVEAVGEGALRAAYEALKRSLDEEGLFDRALPIPPCAKRIGIVTSRAGAVIDDFRKNLDERGYRLLMHDARVEGVRAVPSILAAIRWFKAHAGLVDVMVVMRGGGSLEDLQAFNSEAVAREIASLPMPVIAAIGHDRDVPIANLAADISTSTPSIAAMQVNRSWAEADAFLARATERLVRGSDQVVGRIGRRTELAAERLSSRATLLAHRVGERVTRAASVMRGRLAELREMPERRMDEIRALFGARLSRTGERVLAWERELAIVSPERTLSLGYSIVCGPDGKPVRSVHDLSSGDRVRARFKDGTAEASITDVHPEAN